MFMGLFINNNEHPNVYKNKEEIATQNQSEYKFNFLTELVREQRDANDSLHHSFRDLIMLYEQQGNAHTDQLMELGNHLNELRVISGEHERFEHNVIDMLSKLDKGYEVVLENDDKLREELFEQISVIGKTNEEIVSRLEKYDTANEQLAKKLSEQLEMQKQLAERVDQQEGKQDAVSSRLENQEALTEKILREIHHIRTILFERTSYLAEKIENGYKATSSYIYKLISGSEKQLTLVKNKEPEKKVK